MEADAEMMLDGRVDFGALPGLSAELRGKLAQTRPRSLVEARRIEGMTPAALVLLHAAVLRARKAQAS